MHGGSRRSRSFSPGEAASAIGCMCAGEQLKGSTPLLVASQGGHAECVQALLRGGANVNHVRVGAVAARLGLVTHATCGEWDIAVESGVRGRGVTALFEFVSFWM